MRVVIRLSYFNIWRAALTKYSFKITSRVLFCCGFKLARGTNLIVQGSSHRQRDIFFFVFVFVFFFYRKPNFVHSMILKSCLRTGGCIYKEVIFQRFCFNFSASVEIFPFALSRLKPAAVANICTWMKMSC